MSNPETMLAAQTTGIPEENGSESKRPVPGFELGTLRRDEFPAVATLLHRSLVDYYDSRLRQGARFGDRPEPFLIFPEVYEALDPGESIVAREVGTDHLWGVCFVHPRETHYSVGIVATAPEAAGRGVARAMMAEALRRADAAGKTVRLVSSLLNLDSYSLYSRLGFVPQTIFQDLLITVPAHGISLPEPTGIERVRPAVLEEAAQLADFEAALQGIRREKDFRFFLHNDVGSWKVWVSEDHSGNINGVLVVSLNSAMPMLGPGIFTNEAVAIAMLWRALEELRGQPYVVLAPATASTLIATLYRWGARNIELHVSQTRGQSPIGTGIVFPTFLPETA